MFYFSGRIIGVISAFFFCVNLIVLPAQAQQFPDAVIEVVRAESASEANAAFVNSCASDPDCRKIFALLTAIKLGRTEMGSTVPYGSSVDETAIEFLIEGISASSWVGQLEALVFEASYDFDRGGLLLRFSTLDANVVYFCKEIEEDGTEGPVLPPYMSFLKACDPQEAWGMGAEALTFEWDSVTEKKAMRWAQMTVVYNWLKNGNGINSLWRQLHTHAGLSLDTVWPNEAKPGIGDFTALRLNLGVSGMIRSNNLKWELHGFAAYRPNVFDWSDRAIEVRTEAMRHLLFNQNRLGSLKVEVGYENWSEPWKAVGTRLPEGRDPGFYLRLGFGLITRW